MGRSLRAFWIQFAIPYHTLLLVPGVIVHAEPERLFSDAGSWLEFSRERLWRPLSQKVELVEMGLFAADGTPRF